MKILFANFEYPPLGGGGGVINALLAEELAGRHEVSVLTSQGPGQPRESMEQGVRVIRVPVLFRRKQAAASMISMLSYVLRGASAGSQFLKQHPHDIINTHFALPSGPVGDRLSRRFDIPNVLSVHGGDLYDPSKATSPHRHAPLRSWIRRLARRADRVVGQSRNTLDNLTTYYTPELPGVRIPLGIRRPPEGTSVRSKYGCSEDEVLFIIVGRVVARKAIHQLVNMMARLSGLKARLLVVGDGPLIPDLKRQAQEVGAAERVRFLGRVAEDEKFHLLRMSDAFISTSQHEGFGLVYLEAMACAIPVVCYDYGGQTDFLEQDVTGHLVPLNDEADFERRCRQLAEDRESCARMGKHNLVRVEEYFIENCAARYETLFEEVLRERSQRGDG